ncbi:uncharacterized protein LOC132099255 [Carassius carassius]|uniref:uncharacterized protein LOC132099255 n=1 Tax=Carassius carassius TaxID=217509 RepID=UPI0028695CF7|nr:uncharacterized protein LOC132099255 [Carassius carassius]
MNKYLKHFQKTVPLCINSGYTNTDEEHNTVHYGRETSVRLLTLKLSESEQKYRKGKMNREHGKSINDVYENDIVTKGTFGKRTTDSHTTRIQSSELTGSDGVMIRSSRAAAVVFVLLCVLLLTARIILCATFTQERQELLTKITNLTEERDQLQTNNMNLTEERDQLQTNNMILTEERDQLKSEKNELQKNFAVNVRLMSSAFVSVWSFPGGSRERTSGGGYNGAVTRMGVRFRGDFVKNISGSSGHFWIGLTDVEVEGRWKWVDGSTLTSGSFMNKYLKHFQKTVPLCINSGYTNTDEEHNTVHYGRETSVRLLTLKLSESEQKYRKGKMNREHGKSINDVYENDIVTKGTFGKRTTDSHTTRIQSSELTGSDGVMIRSSRAAAVVFVLLCVLLLTARIILCATFTQERQELLTKITNLTEERDQLQTNNMNLTEERDQLQTNNMILTEERDQLKSEKNELQKNFAVNVRLMSSAFVSVWSFPGGSRERTSGGGYNGAVTRMGVRFRGFMAHLVVFIDGWKCHQSSLYFISSEMKNWTESRSYCRERAADLIIINNTEKQDFVKNISGSSGHFWIGLTDVEVEGRWKWVDGSTLTSGFWASTEPDSHQGTDEDCAINYSEGWADYPCDYMSKWICEESILK